METNWQESQATIVLPSFLTQRLSATRTTLPKHSKTSHGIQPPTTCPETRQPSSKRSRRRAIQGATTGLVSLATTMVVLVFAFGKAQIPSWQRWHETATIIHVLSSSAISQIL